MEVASSKVSITILILIISTLYPILVEYNEKSLLKHLFLTSRQLAVIHHPHRNVYTDSLSTNLAYVNHKVLAIQSQLHAVYSSHNDCPHSFYPQVRVSGGDFGSSVSYHRYDALSYSGEVQALITCML